MPVKIALAGATTAIIGLWIPEILGDGYDIVNFALAGELGLLALTLIVLAKLVATQWFLLLSVCRLALLTPPLGHFFGS